MKRKSGRFFGFASPNCRKKKRGYILGTLVRTLASQDYAPGTYEVMWNGRDDSGAQVASGIYLYIIGAGDFTATKKMVMIR